jgi:hypothetical protein
VDHPGEHVRVKNSAFRGAGFLSVNRTEHAEFEMGRLVVFAADSARKPVGIDSKGVQANKRFWRIATIPDQETVEYDVASGKTADVFDDIFNSTYIKTDLVSEERLVSDNACERMYAGSKPSFVPIFR